MERLGEVMLYNALTALQGWDAAGLDVPQVGVNFSSRRTAQSQAWSRRLRWETRPFDLTPQRLSVEILETVVAASPDDMIVRNIAGLAKLGCQIDLDDFGTGHASISSHPAVRRAASQDRPLLRDEGRPRPRISSA